MSANLKVLVGNHGAANRVDGTRLHSEGSTSERLVHMSSIPYDSLEGDSHTLMNFRYIYMLKPSNSSDCTEETPSI